MSETRKVSVRLQWDCMETGTLRKFPFSSLRRYLFPFWFMSTSYELGSVLTVLEVSINAYTLRNEFGSSAAEFFIQSDGLKISSCKRICLHWFNSAFRGKRRSVPRRQSLANLKTFYYKRRYFGLLIE